MIQKADEYFEGKRELTTLVDRSLKVPGPDVKWVTNIETLHSEFHEIPYFNE